MKKLYFLTVIMVLSALSSWAQYFPFNDIQEIQCPYDSTQTVFMSSNYMVYSTLNDEWDGIRDSTLCYTVEANSTLFDLAQVPPGRKVFAEVVLQDSISLFPHHEYLLSPVFSSNFSYLCDSAACRKAILEFLIPDSVVGPMVHRVRMFDIENSPVFGPDAICFASEKFSDQLVTRIIFEYFPEDSAVHNLVGAELYDNYSSSLIPPVFHSSPVDYFGGNIVPQFDTIYPSSEAISYSEFVPFSNPTDSQHLDIYVDQYSVLLFEPFTGLRGALVEGSDSIRHSITLFNEGKTCLPFVEIMLEGNNSLVVDNGAIDLQHDRACFLVGKGGTFKIKTGTKLDYGRFGRGMLVLKPGANVVIESGAELNIGCQTYFYEYPDTPNEDVIIDLVKGAKLSFAPSATLSNQYSIDGSIRLKVRMLGGELDDTGLSAAEKQLIERIYVKPDDRFQDNLSIYPNPVASDLEFTWVAKKAGKQMRFEVLDISGKVIITQTSETSHKGHNVFSVDVNELGSGIYFLKMSENGASVSKRFVKL